MKIVQLTHMGNPVFLNPGHITIIWPLSKGSLVCFGYEEANSVRVEESPEEIQKLLEEVSA